MSIQTIDITGRRRWLLWGERRHEYHLQLLRPQVEADQGRRTLCGRQIASESRSVVVPDPHLCPHCVQAAEVHYRGR